MEGGMADTTAASGLGSGSGSLHVPMIICIAVDDALGSTKSNRTKVPKTHLNAPTTIVEHTWWLSVLRSPPPGPHPCSPTCRVHRSLRHHKPTSLGSAHAALSHLYHHPPEDGHFELGGSSTQIQDRCILPETIKVGRDGQILRRRSIRASTRRRDAGPGLENKRLGRG
ncbi:hypothetical protein OE88DRAFT_179533 [Heliocybe sulcata]|uniref:Uncharacterized protein n=1 Tax=Heliocybe sulcata TaxID=5364 RepID=A0A5C3N176_9AGAM|nr:hypothetical protein OE88DRAFT_179533 [Heliocybe sulcata]